MAARWWFALASLLALAGCGGGSGTYVVVHIEGNLTGIRKLELTATFGGVMSPVVPLEKTDGTVIVLPVTKSLEIRNGEGQIDVRVVARDEAGAELASGSTSGQVMRGHTTDVVVCLGSCMVDAGVDGGDGGGDTAVLVLSPSSKDFGALAPGATGSQIFMVTNMGSGASGILTASITGAGAAAFATNGGTCQGQLLAPAGSCMLAVSFTPQTGTSSASLEIANSTGTSGVAALQGSALSPASLALTPSSVDFGSVVQGQSGTVSLQVVNNGQIATPALTTTITGNTTDFMLGTNGCAGQPLAAGGSCTVQLLFTPASTGTKSASLAIASGAGGPMGSAPMTGIGVAQGSLVVTVPAIASTAVGSMTSVTATVRNSGGSPTGAIGTATLGGGDAAQFAIVTDGCTGMTLAASATCSIALRFQPTSAGAKSASLTVPASPGGPGVGALAATGTAQLTVAVSGGNGSGSLTSSPAGITCPGTCTATFSQPSVVLTPAASAGSDFTSWSGGGCTGTGNCTVPMSAATVMVTAAFTLKSYLLTAATTGTGGGTVRSGDSRINCPGTCSASYNHGSMVVLTATPDGTSTFGGYSGGGCGASATCTVPMTMAHTVTATFTRVAMADVSVTLTDAPDPVNVGSNITYTAVARNNGPDSAAAVTLTDTLSGSVNYVSASATQGSCSRSGVTVTCSLGSIASGATATATITATAASAGSISNSASVSTTTSDPTSSNNSTSTTTQANAVGATITVTLSGSGTVTSSPAGISCPGTCSASFTAGTSVTLTARGPNNGATRFGGWSGACSGIVRSGCVVVASGSQSVSASFVGIANNLAFLSSGTFAGTLGGTAAYDTQCNTLATAAGINNAAGTAYMALMADGNSGTPQSRIGSFRGFIRVDGKEYADDLASMYSSPAKMYSPLLMTENGDLKYAVFPWTGQDANGAVSPTLHCSNWSPAGTMGFTGQSDYGPYYAFSIYNHACTTMHEVYCVQRTYTAALTPAPVSGKYIWLGKLVPGGGVSALDTHCNNTKPAGAVGAGKALVAMFNPGRTASSLISSSATYVRPDGMRVATGAALLANQPLETGVFQLGDGTYNSLAQLINQGTNSISALPTAATETCADWTSAASASVRAGIGTIAVNSFWGAGATNCNRTNWLYYCIEQ